MSPERLRMSPRWSSYAVHDLNLIWLAELRDAQPAVEPGALVALDSPDAESIDAPDHRADRGRRRRWMG